MERRQNRICHRQIQKKLATLDHLIQEQYAIHYFNF